MYVFYNTHTLINIFLIFKVIEIILYCVDANQIKTTGLEEAFAPIFKYNIHTQLLVIIFMI